MTILLGADASPATARRKPSAAAAAQGAVTESFGIAPREMRLREARGPLDPGRNILNPPLFNAAARSQRQVLDREAAKRASHVQRARAVGDELVQLEVD